MSPIPQNDIEVEIRCPVETRVLSVIRSIVSALANQVGFDEEQLAQIEMAVDEACSNVICHAYKHLGVSSRLPECEAAEEVRRMCVLTLSARIETDALHITISDRGIGMNRMEPGVKSLEEYRDRGGDGGLGVYIIENFMDEVKYDYPKDSGTILRMTKFLRTSAQASE